MGLSGPLCEDTKTVEASFESEALWTLCALGGAGFCLFLRFALRSWESEEMVSLNPVVHILATGQSVQDAGKRMLWLCNTLRFAAGRNKPRAQSAKAWNGQGALGHSK